MHCLLSEIRTQYWFWFVRNKLIDYELKDIASNKGRQVVKVVLKGKCKNDSKIAHRNIKLLQQLEFPTKTNIYSRAVMADWIFEISNCEEVSNIIANDGDKYKNATIPVPQETVDDIDKIISDSRLAYEDGPSGLFVIIEAQTLLEALYTLANRLLIVLEKNLRKFKKHDELTELKESLVSHIKFGIFGGTIKLLKTIEDIFDHLFPDNQWDNFTPSVSTFEVNIESFDRKSLHQPKYIDLDLIVPVLIGFAFFRARFFDEVHYLANVCYKEGYLKILYDRFLITEELWRFDTDKKDTAEMINKGRPVIRHIFQRAYIMANPVLFANTFKNIE